MSGPHPVGEDGPELVRMGRRRSALASWAAVVCTGVGVGLISGVGIVFVVVPDAPATPWLAGIGGTLLIIGAILRGRAI